MKIVGKLTSEVIKAFGLDYEEGKEISLSLRRKRHMEKHRDEFSDFDETFESIDEIISNPDFVGLHPNGKSLEYVKKIDGNVLVAVRLGDNLDVQTMYVVKESKLQNYINSGRTKKM